MCNASVWRDRQSPFDAIERSNIVANNRRRRPRAKLSPEVRAEILRRLALGDYQHDIAADLGLDQGRISEVNTGKR